MSHIAAGSEGELEVIDHLRMINTSVPLAEIWVLVPFFLISIFIACMGWLFVEVRSQLGDTMVRAQARNLDSSPHSSGPPMDEITPSISPIFSSSVRWWEPEILRWSQQHDLPPNLIALVMQIESCGDPQVTSNAGATGLFQVMPYHFDPGEDPFQPATNAQRGLNYLSESFRLAEGDVARTLAGYNGGHGVIARPLHTWAEETQRYVSWGSGIWTEVKAGSAASSTLSSWLEAGGERLCNSALHWQVNNSNEA